MTIRQQYDKNESGINEGVSSAREVRICSGPIHSGSQESKDGGDSEEDGSGSNTKQKRLIDIHELAKRLDIPASWFYQRTRLGQSAIPHYKIGKYVRFDFDEVTAFLRAKQNENCDERQG